MKFNIKTPWTWFRSTGRLEAITFLCKGQQNWSRTVFSAPGYSLFFLMMSWWVWKCFVDFLNLTVRCFIFENRPTGWFGLAWNEDLLPQNQFELLKHLLDLPDAQDLRKGCAQWRHRQTFPCVLLYCFKDLLTLQTDLDFICFSQNHQEAWVGRDH